VKLLYNSFLLGCSSLFLTAFSPFANMGLAQTVPNTAVFQLPGTANPELFNLDFQFPSNIRSSPQPRNYGFLKQIPLKNNPLSEPFGYVLVLVRKENGVWKIRTTDNEIRNQVNLRWYAQAACNDRLTLFRVTGPNGESKTQKLKNNQKVIYGEFNIPSFLISTIKKIAINWAEKTDDNEEMIPLYENYSLVGDQSPATKLDGVRLETRCANGEVFDELYYPKIEMRVSRQDI
jgi:hypothetical protein